ncbi:MAG TPA: formyltransferase family protein [Pyrinomonadaceae bacterium]|nr:formyltransferase family protein [Pyrinomonadaceae bacterium]
MRTGILANSLPAALKIYDEVKTVPACETFILLCPSQGEARGRTLLKHPARFLLKSGRLKSLRLIFSGKVILFQKALDHPETLARLKALNLDVGLHHAGEIYRERTINAFRLGILNPHIGILPRYRGRSVMEWSLLEGSEVGVTVFFIDTGIDTGRRILFSEEVDISHCRSIEEAKLYLFSLDAHYFRCALELLGSGDFEYKENDVGQGRRYYVMSRLFQGVVEKMIEAES